MAAAYFFDSSALVKRYVLETGTAWVRSITRKNASTVVYFAHITAVEVACRRTAPQRENTHAAARVVDSPSLPAASCRPIRAHRAYAGAR
jgi:predicted nucleic acid-binding protein